MDSDQSVESNATADGQPKTRVESLDIVEKLKKVHRRLDESNRHRIIMEERLLETMDEVNGIRRLLLEKLHMDGQVQLNPHTSSEQTPLVTLQEPQNEVEVELVGFQDTINSYPQNMGHVQMDGQVQLKIPEVSDPHTRSVNGQLEVNDTSKDINSVAHNSVGDKTPLVALQEPPNASEFQIVCFQDTINSYPKSMVDLSLQKNNFQINHTEESQKQQITQGINSLHNNCFETCNDINEITKIAENKIKDKKRRFYNNKYNYLNKVRVSYPNNLNNAQVNFRTRESITKIAENKIEDRKRRFYNNKYNYLNVVRNSHPNNLNNATVNAQVDFKTGESIIIPDRNFRIHRKPIRLLQPIIKLKRCDD